MDYTNISLRDDVYENLVKMKAKGKSFSDVIFRLIHRGSLLDFAGRWDDLSKKNIENLKYELEKERDTTKEREE